PSLSTGSSNLVVGFMALNSNRLLKASLRVGRNFCRLVVGITETLELNKYKQREVYQLQQLEIRPGERMRFTKNIRNSDYKQLNGQRFTVEGITNDGPITIIFKRKFSLDISLTFHFDSFP
ncbi:MAG: hypothetical protein QNJ72_17755, partial [Pleurocapsa sp. MO_226.B13]|nr:hypothetical protein [Pleurocapsa sp. MO_226.B13]